MSGLATVVPFDRVTPVEDLAAGIAWVRWLLQSVRARCQQVCFAPDQPDESTVGSSWSQFSVDHYLPLIGPQITEAWHVAVARDHEALTHVDMMLDERLPARVVSSSRAAGAVLLRTTRGARYQGVLGHYRAAVEAGGAPGHFIVVWAAVGCFFQLSLANVLAEHLRLEWDIATRDLAQAPPPEGTHSFAALVRSTLDSLVTDPLLLRREG
ncbi:MAG: hypothetical protein K1X78_01580 [Verrucomicrobiaceae bacterium]|nr:hypothetical protein [Verrucomicrobiaceae bacterium]